MCSTGKLGLVAYPGKPPTVIDEGFGQFVATVNPLVRGLLFRPAIVSRCSALSEFVSTGASRVRGFVSVTVGVPDHRSLPCLMNGTDSERAQCESRRKTRKIGFWCSSAVCILSQSRLRSFGPQCIVYFRTSIKVFHQAQSRLSAVALGTMVGILGADTLDTRCSCCIVLLRSAQGGSWWVRRWGAHGNGHRGV